MDNPKKYVFNPHKDLFINGYKCGLRPKEILAIVKFHEMNYCLMTWNDTDDTSYVKYSFARNKFPSIVIKFFEKLTQQISNE